MTVGPALCRLHVGCQRQCRPQRVVATEATDAATREDAGQARPGIAWATGIWMSGRTSSRLALRTTSSSMPEFGCHGSAEINCDRRYKTAPR
jgi:hypothetical protein